MGKLAFVGRIPVFRRRFAIEAGGVDAETSIISFPCGAAYRVTVCVRGYFRTHTARGAGIGVRSAKYLDDIAAARDELVTDTDVFRTSEWNVEHGSHVEIQGARIAHFCTRHPIHSQTPSLVGYGVWISEEGERAHVGGLRSVAAAAAIAGRDAYVNGPKPAVAVIMGRVYGPHPKGLFKDSGATSCLACAVF